MFAPPSPMMEFRVDNPSQMMERDIPLGPPKDIVRKLPQNYGINNRLPVSQSTTPTGLLNPGGAETGLMQPPNYEHDFNEETPDWSNSFTQYYSPQGKFKTRDERLDHYLGKERDLTKKLPRNGYDILEQWDTPMRNQFITLRDRVKKELGLEIDLIEGFRTAEKQDKDWEKGRKLINGVWKITDDDKVVTNVRGGHSNHQTGRAFDFNFFPYIKKEDQNSEESVNKFRAVAKIAKTMGFKWSGDWKKRPELGHLEWVIEPSKKKTAYPEPKSARLLEYQRLLRENSTE